MTAVHIRRGEETETRSDHACEDRVEDGGRSPQAQEHRGWLAAQGEENSAEQVLPPPEGAWPCRRPADVGLLGPRTARE